MLAISSLIKEYQLTESSNGAAVYCDRDHKDTKYVVKTYSNKTKPFREYIGNKFTKHFVSETPDCHLLFNDEGKIIGVASEFIKGLSDLEEADLGGDRLVQFRILLIVTKILQDYDID